MQEGGSTMSEQLELFSAVMSETKQAEENPIRNWVRFEPSVWTESMRNAPNVYFRELGLFSLNDAYREALRPLRR